MKETYLKHYWLLYMEFMEAFKSLTYKNIPLPLLINFYQFIEETIKNDMYQDSFSKNLKYDNFQKEKIQPFFEKFLPNIQTSKVDPEGLIVLNHDYIRFPAETFKEHFTTSPSAILTRKKARVSNDLGIPYHSLSEYQDQGDVHVETSIVKKAETIFSKHVNHIVFGNQFFKEKFKALIPTMIRLFNTIEKYLEKVSVKCIIVGTIEDINSRILAILCRVKGIPSICMQHGLIMGEEAYLPVFTTKVAVYGYYEKDWYKERGTPESQVEIIGHPRFDQIFTRKFPSKKELDSTKINVLITTNHLNQMMWVKVIKSLAKLPQFNIIVKPHPWEVGKKKCTDYEKLSSTYHSVNLILSRNVNLYDVFNNIDFVILSASTVGLEAMLFQKPTFIIKNSVYPYFDRMGKFNLDETEVVKTIIQFSKDKEMQKEMENLMRKFIAQSYPQKLSGIKLVNLIKELTS